MGLGLSLASAVILAVTPVYAAESALGEPGDCFSRVYDAEHLKSHPDQRVERFAIGHHPDFQDPNYDLTLLFGFRTRDGNEYVGVGLCKGNSCGVEGDGGVFSLSMQGEALRLEVDPERGMSAESAVDFINLAESDDRVFLLYPSSAKACRF